MGCRTSRCLLRRSSLLRCPSRPCGVLPAMSLLTAPLPSVPCHAATAQTSCAMPNVSRTAASCRANPVVSWPVLACRFLDCDSAIRQVHALPRLEKRDDCRIGDAPCLSPCSPSTPHAACRSPPSREQPFHVMQLLDCLVVPNFGSPVPTNPRLPRLVIAERFLNLSRLRCPVRTANDPTERFLVWPACHIEPQPTFPYPRLSSTAQISPNLDSSSRTNHDCYGGRAFKIARRRRRSS